MNYFDLHSYFYTLFDTLASRELCGAKGEETLVLILKDSQGTKKESGPTLPSSELELGANLIWGLSQPWCRLLSSYELGLQ